LRPRDELHSLDTSVRSAQAQKPGSSAATRIPQAANAQHRATASRPQGAPLSSCGLAQVVGQPVVLGDEARAAVRAGQLLEAGQAEDPGSHPQAVHRRRPRLVTDSCWCRRALPSVPGVLLAARDGDAPSRSGGFSSSWLQAPDRGSTIAGAHSRCFASLLCSQIACGYTFRRLPLLLNDGQLRRYRSPTASAVLL